MGGGLHSGGRTSPPPPPPGNFEASHGDECAFNEVFNRMQLPELSHGFNWTDEGRNKWGVRARNTCCCSDAVAGATPG
jgi:hypothetical protein